MTSGMMLRLQTGNLLERSRNSEVGLLKMVRQAPLAMEDSKLSLAGIICTYLWLALGHIEL